MPCLPSSYTFTATDAGKHSFAVTLGYVGHAVDHGDRHSDIEPDGTESGIAVQAAAAKTLTVTGFPTSDTAGTAGT